jgi:small-conductance mechanosensitive channel
MITTLPLFKLSVAAVLLCCVAIVGGRLSSALTHRFWRAGYDVERKLALVASVFRFALVVGAAMYIVGLLIPTIERLALPVSLFVGGAVLVASFPALQNTLAGLYLIARDDVREGDRLRVGDTTGVVRDLGLGRVRIRLDDGTGALIPNRLLLQQPIEVQRSSGRARVEVELDDRDYDSSDLARAREAAHLCPYRVKATPVHVRLVDHRISVEIQTWRPRCHEEVASYLNAALELPSKNPAELSVPSPR